MLKVRFILDKILLHHRFEIYQKFTNYSKVKMKQIQVCGNEIEVPLIYYNIESSLEDPDVK